MLSDTPAGVSLATTGDGHNLPALDTAICFDHVVLLAYASLPIRNCRSGPDDVRRTWSSQDDAPDRSVSNGLDFSGDCRCF